MRPLVLCQACKRHVKGGDAQCPFCGTAGVALRECPPASTELGSPKAPARARGVPGGRAALFLAGSVLAPGCAEEMATPVYGGPIDSGQNDAGNTGDAAARDGGPDAGGIMVGPVYGIAIDSGVDAGADAALTDSACPQVGNLPVPVYGIPVDSGTRRDLCTDAGPDAGKDAGVIGFPPYGIAVDP